MAYLSVWMEGLTPELEKKAEEELGETPEVKTRAVKELRKLIHEQADFRPRIDEAFLVRFLRARKYKVDKAYETLRKYYIFKARYSGVLTDFLPSEVRAVLETNNLVVLPKRHPSGAAVGIIRIGHYDIDRFTPEEIFSACMVVLEVNIEPEATQVAGYIAIVDLGNVTLRTARHYYQPTLLYRCLKATQDCIPYRLKGYHVVNEPFCVGFFFNLVKKLLSEKLRKRIYFHGNNMKSLHQHIPVDLLPSEYGGTLGPMNCTDLCNRVLSRDAQFEKLNKFGFQEKTISFIRKQDSKSIFA